MQMTDEKPFSYCRDPNRIEGDYQQYMTSGLIDLCEWLKGRTPMKVMCEVGSAFGESAEIFARYFRVVHCVDDWSSVDPSLPDPEHSFDIRQRRNPNIVKHRCTSIQAYAHFAMDSLDFAYIDANHKRANVLSDIERWMNKSWKYIGGHDYGAPSCPGVKEAVDKLFGKPDMTFKDFSWVVKV
jgi:hypothetical protein